MMGQTDRSGYGFAPDTEMPRVSRTKQLHERIAELERAIVEHRTSITNAGTIKVQPGYEQVAEAKHLIDQRLWKVVG